MENEESFLVLVHKTMNDAVLEYFNDTSEAVTHYTSPAGFLNIIQSKELWFGNINNVNDINELNYAFRQVIYPCINNYKFTISSLRNKILSLVTRLKNRKFSFINGNDIKFKKASIFVFSTSFDEDSSTLWQLYCKDNDSKGYAITFDKTKFTGNLYNYNIKRQGEVWEGDSFSNCSIHYLLEGKVIYNREKQIEIINNYLGLIEYAVEQQDSENTIQAILDIYVQKFLILALFMKDADFDKENEYRFAVICDDEFIDTNKNNSPYLVFGTSNNNIVSRLAVPFGEELIKSIKISPFISDIEAMETTQYFLKKHGVVGIDAQHNLPKIRK